MFIWKDTKLRAPDYPHTIPYTDEGGTRYVGIPLHLLDEIEEPPLPPEVVANPEWYLVTPQDDFPYRAVTKKLDSVIREMQTAKVQEEIRQLESNPPIPRLVREALLYLAEKEAEKVAESMSTPEASVTREMVLAANFGYQKTKEIEDKIVILRSQL